MRESEFQKRVVRQLRLAGAEVLNLIPNEMMGRDWPDIYVAHRVWSGWIEFKVDSYPVRAGQKKMIFDLTDRDVQAIVLRLRGGEKLYEQWFNSEGAGNEEFVMDLKDLTEKNGAARLLSYLALEGGGGS